MADLAMRGGAWRRPAGPEAEWDDHVTDQEHSGLWTAHGARTPLLFVADASLHVGRPPVGAVRARVMW